MNDTEVGRDVLNHLLKADDGIAVLLQSLATKKEVIVVLRDQIDALLSAVDIYEKEIKELKEKLND